MSNFSLTREDSHLLLCSALHTSIIVSPRLLRNEEMSLSARSCSDMVFTIELDENEDVDIPKELLEKVEPSTVGEALGDDVDYGGGCR